jgi:hypothetical protein
MRFPYEPNARPTRAPRSLGRMIRDQEMWRVTDMLNAPTARRRRSVSFVERYRSTPYDTGLVPAPIPLTVRSRLRSLLP